MGAKNRHYLTVEDVFIMPNLATYRGFESLWELAEDIREEQSRATQVNEVELER